MLTAMQAAVILALESARDEMSARIEAQQWRPIETAPKDGTQYLACDGKKMWTRNQPPNCYAGDWEWNQNRTQWRGHADGLNPTHWMPLPAQPARPTIDEQVASVNAVGEVLGHRSAASTRRYAHLQTAALRGALATVGRKVA